MMPIRRTNQTARGQTFCIFGLPYCPRQPPWLTGRCFVSEVCGMPSCVREPAPSRFVVSIS